MPNRPAAKKSLKQNAKRRQRNKTVRSRLRTEQNKFDRMIERGDVESAAEQLSVLTKLYQQAASKNILHANRAARKQSQAQQRLNRAREAANV